MANICSRYSCSSAGVPPVVSTVVNASSEVPMVTMRILNENHKDQNVTQLGQKLTLRIEIHPANGEPLDLNGKRVWFCFSIL